MRIAVVQLRVCWSASRYSTDISITHSVICRWSIRPTHDTAPTDTHSDLHGLPSLYFCWLASSCLSTREKKRTLKKTSRLSWAVCNLTGLTERWTCISSCSLTRKVWLWPSCFCVRGWMYRAVTYSLDARRNRSRCQYWCNQSTSSLM